MAIYETKSKPKLQIMEFLKATANNTTPHYSFIYAGDVHQAKAFVQAMRTELSRLRDEVRKQGKTIRPFKMRQVSIEPTTRSHTVNPESLVKLFKHVNGMQIEIAKDVAAIIDSIALSDGE